MASDRHFTARDFFSRLNWLDGAPLLSRMEPYRLAIFEQAFDTFDANGRLAYNLILCGRAKKNWKTADLVLACYLALLTDSKGGNQCYIVANDSDQAGDDLVIAKKLKAVNPWLDELIAEPKKNVIERKDGQGFIEVLPAQDAVGSHGKTYRLLAVDEIHGYRNWDLLEALAPDPTRPDAQQWITSYASIYHKPGVPLYDMTQRGRLGTDPRMFFSWYAADYVTDPAFEDKAPHARANPSSAAFSDDYLDQQQRRLPAHKFRRLHLNLPGQPEGSAFQPEPVMDAVERGVIRRPARNGIDYQAFVDMSGGSSDDAVLSIGHMEGQQMLVDVVMNQGAPAPFDPRLAVERFANTLREYGVHRVRGDRYAGQTFVKDFERHRITYELADLPKSKLYEALEPKLNAREVVLLDDPRLEQQLLGLVWRGGKIDHPAGEHDDWANGVAGVVYYLAPIVFDSVTIARTTGHAYGPSSGGAFAQCQSRDGIHCWVHAPDWHLGVPLATCSHDPIYVAMRNSKEGTPGVARVTGR